VGISVPAVGFSVDIAVLVGGSVGISVPAVGFSVDIAVLVGGSVGISVLTAVVPAVGIALVLVVLDLVRIVLRMPPGDGMFVRWPTVVGVVGVLVVPTRMVLRAGRGGWLPVAVLHVARSLCVERRARIAQGGQCRVEAVSARIRGGDLGPGPRRRDLPPQGADDGGHRGPRGTGHDQ
jgi:hypothetical protein